jgi:hypothetical protein
VHQRLKVRSTANEQRTNSFRGSDLVTGDRQQVELLGSRIDMDFPEGLHSISMKNDASGLRLGRKLRDCLNRSDFVVDPHDRADGDVVSNESIERFPRHRAVRVDIEKPLFGALCCRLVDGAKNRLVFDGRRDDGVSAFGLRVPPGAEEGEVVAFSAAGRETDFIGTGAKAARYALACFIECSARFATPPVRAGRVSKAGPEKGPHCFENFLPDGGSCRVIEVNRVWLHALPR